MKDEARREGDELQHRCRPVEGDKGGSCGLCVMEEKAADVAEGGGSGSRCAEGKKPNHGFL